MFKIGLVLTGFPVICSVGPFSLRGWANLPHFFIFTIKNSKFQFKPLFRQEGYSIIKEIESRQNLENFNECKSLV